MSTETQAFYRVVCDECRSIRVFTTERQRDLWEKHHTHDQSQDGYGDD